MTLFASLGVSEANWRVRDRFSDFRVDALFKALPLFGELLGQGFPVHTVLGTLLFFSCVLWGVCAATSHAVELDRASRMFVVVVSLQNLMSFHLLSVTGKNTCLAWLGPFFLFALGCISRIWRCGTLMLEFSLDSSAHAATQISSQPWTCIMWLWRSLTCSVCA